MNEDASTTELKIFFDQPKTFDLHNIKSLTGLTGLYFIYSDKTEIQYPFRKSRLLYIGMSEKRTNSMGSRLTGHFDGKSKNLGLVNYRKTDQLYFTYINFDMLRKFWNFRIEDLESYFILDFVENYGVYPICNNKSGLHIMSRDLKANFEIDWRNFE